MAYICKTCRLVSSKRYSNCPRCGFSLMEDDRTVEEWTQADYREIGKGHKPSVSIDQHTTPKFVIDDNEYLNELRRSFGQTPTPSQPNASGTDAQQPQKNTTTPHTSPETKSHPATMVGNPVKNTEEDTPFFTHNNSEPPPAQETVPNQDFEAIHPENSLDFHTRQRRPLSNGYGFWQGLRSLFFLIPWRAVFILITILAIISIILTIWNLRHQILGAVVGFIIELFPLILIIGGIIYLIRRVFR